MGTGDTIKTHGLVLRWHGQRGQIDRASAAAAFSDVTLLLADGEENLGDLIAEIDSETFDAVDDLETGLHNVLPREAIGEPYQSEGDA